MISRITSREKGLSVVSILSKVKVEVWNRDYYVRLFLRLGSGV